MGLFHVKSGKSPAGPIFKSSRCSVPELRDSEVPVAFAQDVTLAGRGLGTAGPWSRRCWSPGPPSPPDTLEAASLQAPKGKAFPRGARGRATLPGPRSSTQRALGQQSRLRGSIFQTFLLQARSALIFHPHTSVASS